MPSERRSIFRPDAVRRYEQRHAEQLSPPLHRSRTFVYLWMLLAVLFACGIFISFATRRILLGA
jgi:hypothetical protein